jgi:hypothetical protein
MDDQSAGRWESRPRPRLFSRWQLSVEARFFDRERRHFLAIDDC